MWFSGNELGGATFTALGAAVSMMQQDNAESDFYILPFFFFGKRKDLLQTSVSQ